MDDSDLEWAVNRSSGEWSGKFEGGPMDGAPFTIDASMTSIMWDLRVSIRASPGPDVADAEWHIYTFGQRMNPETYNAEFTFNHAGTVADPPVLP